MTNTNPARIGAVTLLVLLLALGLPQGHWDGVAGRALAQDNTDELLVSITRVDSEDFPQVTAFVAVSGEGGLPLDGLDDHFTLLEDGEQVLASSVAVEEDVSQSFSMVLALDVSTSPENLALVQEAVKFFLDTLGPQDEMALLAFYNEVRVEQDFTGSKSALNAAVNALGAQGDRTVLNQAVLEAATLAGDPPSGRGAVVVFTDSADNVRNVSIDDVANRARDLRVPIYTIGFGPKIRETDLQELADLTGGRAFVLTDLDEMQGQLREIGELLHQGYKIVFQSGLQADDAEHDLQVDVVYQGQTGQAQGRFVAVPGEVLVSLPDLVEGQTVGGVVNLAALVTATTPASIVSVEYLLDGELLAEVTDPPFSFEWDSMAVDPGSYTLAARALDSAGNRGQVEVGFEVALPVVVALSTDQDVVELGFPVSLEAQVEALAEVQVVEFLLDGELLGSVDAFPYRFSFDSGDYLAGAHTITARAQDELGREHQASLDVEFAAPPPLPTPSPTPEPPPESEKSTGWLIIPAALVALAIVIACGIALITLLRQQRESYRVRYSLEIANLGNVRSRYELQATEPSGALEFDFSLGGNSLHQRQTAEVHAGDSAGVEDAPSAPASSSRAKLAGVGQAATKTKGVSRNLANWLSNAASFLPRSIGAPLLKMSGQVRKGEQAVSRVERSSRRAGQAKALVPASALPSSQAGAEPSPASVSVAGATETAVHTWDQTPFVEPGETLTVDLLIDPANPYQTQHYPFTVLSRSVEQEDAPLVVEEAGVQIVRPSWIHRFYPFLIVFVVMAITSVLFVVFLVSMGMWG